jgi:penicillin amidase
MKRFKSAVSILIPLVFTVSVQAGQSLPGLEGEVTLTRDVNGIPHISATSEHDLFFMQGRVHAEDRLFQMDLLRRSANGTLAELFGPDFVPNDIETRTIGLDRAAKRSLAEHSGEMLRILEAYSAGVNSYLAEGNALPLEYSYLGLSRVKPWQPLDSVLVGKALGAGTSLIIPDDIDLTIALGAYQQAGVELEAFDMGFDGTSLFFEDLYRSAPFDPASSVVDAMAPLEPQKSKQKKHDKKGHRVVSEKGVEHAKDYLERIRKLKKIPGTMSLEGGDMGGSNAWVISGEHTRNGQPLLANDMHLRLESPVIFHEVHLQAPGLDVAGSSMPGAPCVVRGHNQAISWGVTNARLDITDIYGEIVFPSQDGDHDYDTMHGGVLEPVVEVAETFKAHVGGDFLMPIVSDYRIYTLPRRNHGPLITTPSGAGPFPGSLTALSVQSVGFGPTLDPEGLCDINRASNLDEFKAAMQKIDFASQNLLYADRDGNIGYFVSGEVPLREDLQSLAGEITPPFLIRNGYYGNEWLPLPGERPPQQATPFAILPFDEMPQVVNPPAGFIVNANNDQMGNTLDNNPLNDLREGGNGLLYLNWGGRNFSIRAGRETEMITELLSRHKGEISRKDMRDMQADVVLNDARALVPYIEAAYRNARRNAHSEPLLASLAQDSRVKEAVKRMSRWDFRAPTGIAEGYDAKRRKGDKDASVATTIYSTWRGKIIAGTIDATLDRIGLAGYPRPGQREELVTALKHLLENNGVGHSGLNFFQVPGVEDAATRRDIVVLSALRDALDLLASDAFAPAFANSTDQDDYRWGRLHRIVMKHPLGGIEGNFNVPSAFGAFPAPLEGEGLPGIPTDGGFETVDEAPPEQDNVRVSDSDSFMFEFGPTGRYVAEIGHRGVKAETSLPGGESAVPGSPYYVNLLEPWLQNKTFKMGKSGDGAVSIEVYQPW